MVTASGGTREILGTTKAAQSSGNARGNGLIARHPTKF